MNRFKRMKAASCFCALLAGTMISQPVLTVFAEVITIEKVVKTKYSDEIKELFEKMEVILLELEAVENVYEAGQEEEFVEKVSLLTSYFFEISELDKDREFLIERKEGDLLDVLFARTINILYEMPMKTGHPIIKEFAKNLRDSYFEQRYIMYKDLLDIFIAVNPDSQLSSLFEKYAIQLEVFGMLPPDVEYDPDSIPEINEAIKDSQLPEFNIVESTQESMREEWKELYAESGIDIDTGSSLSSANKPIVQIPANKNRITYDVSYDVVGNKCVKTEVKKVNGARESSNSEKIDDNIAYRYCPTSYFASLYEGFQDDDELISSSSEIYKLKYIYDEGNEREVNFLMEGENVSYNQLISVLDMIVKEQGGKIAYDKEKILYVLDGKPLIIYQYEKDKSLDEVNKLIGKYVPLKFSISKED